MPDNDDARPRATLLLTRPRAASERFAADVTLRRLPAKIVICPLMKIAPVGIAPVLAKDAHLIFTSAHAIAAAGPGQGRRAWCVGARTTEAASNAGFDAILAGATADELIARLEHERPPNPLVHLRGHHQRGDVAERLMQAGITVTSHVVYDQVALPPDDAFATALGQSPLLVPLFSPRSATLFAQAATGLWQPSDEDAIVVLSAAVKEALPPDLAQMATTAGRPDGPAMVDEVARRISPSGDSGGVTRY